jgi:hypothetical protein
MKDSVYRVTEVIGVSAESWEAAARTQSRRPPRRFGTSASLSCFAKT